MDQQYKYFAFISYNSHDTAWGHRLQQKLESYRMPSTLCSERGWQRTPIKPVFFAPTDIQPGGLTAELQERLRASRNLIVICSPNSARSEWVGREIEYFHSLGRTSQIHFFIVDGVPHSGDPQTECFNPVLKSLGLPEILGANVHEQTQTFPFTSIPWPRMNRERAYVQLVSKLLGVEFDAIWLRHRRMMLQKAVAWTLGCIAVVAALLMVWLMNKPVDVRVQLREATPVNTQLPPMRDAVVTITLDNEVKKDTLSRMTDGALFTNIPHRFLGKRVRLSFSCRDYLPVDTTLSLTSSVLLPVRRDAAVYGRVRFLLFDPIRELPVAGCPLRVAGYELQSDADGRVALFIPLPEQRTAYPVEARRPLEADSVYVPCGEDDVILIRE